MWSRLRASKTSKVQYQDNQRFPRKSLDIEVEYGRAIRTQSYVDFFEKAQLFGHELEPDQHLVVDTLNSVTKPVSDLLLDFFDTSAKTSLICTHILRSINETHDDYKFVQRALDKFETYFPEQYSSAVNELDSFTTLVNPFDTLKINSFGDISSRYAAILHGLNLNKKKKMKKKIKMVGFLKKVVQCNSSCCNYKVDVTTKGAYILSRDFDTTSRLVVRVRDEVEHMKEMLRYCLERREDRFPLQQVVKDPRKRGRGFKTQVEELEEHVCLCLVTINRARILVAKEMS